MIPLHFDSLVAGQQDEVVMCPRLMQSVEVGLGALSLVVLLLV